MDDTQPAGSSTFRILHTISLDLAKAATLDDLYRGLVDRGLRDLGFDRIGLILFDRKTSVMSGTWGTDAEGRLKNEADFSQVLKPESTFVWDALGQKDYVALSEKKNLWHYNTLVGTGWNAMVALWDNDEPIGWIAVDNLLRGLPCTEEIKNTIAYYGNTASHLIIRKRFELELQTMVDRKTRELADKVELLERTLDHLVEAEKLASLGRLVAGVAHEINTPLGNAVLGLSYSRDIVTEVRTAVASDSLDKPQLLARLAEAGEGLNSVTGNLDRTAQLVLRFKQLARDQHDESPDPDMEVEEVVRNILAGFQHLLKVNRVKVRTEVEPGLVVPSFPGMLTQVLGNLIANTVDHGLPEEGGPVGQIDIDARRTDRGTWLLGYRDHGPGVPPDLMARIFEPFFTTTRGHGGSGLGLSIVHTLVYEKMGGTLEAFRPDGGGLGFWLEFPAETAL